MGKPQMATRSPPDGTIAYQTPPNPPTRLETRFEVLEERP